MSRPIVTTVTLGAATPTGVAASQARGSAGNLTLNGSLVSGGVATFDAPRRVIVTSAGNDTGITFTVTGKSRPEQGGGIFSETISGANAGAAQTTQDFATVTQISASGAAAGNVSAGTNSVGSGPWVVWSEYKTDFMVSIAGIVKSGAPTWQVDYTYDDVFGLWLPPGQSFVTVWTHPLLVGMTGSGDGSILVPTRASRLTLTAVGSVQLTQTQQGA